MSKRPKNCKCKCTCGNNNTNVKRTTKATNTIIKPDVTFDFNPRRSGKKRIMPSLIKKKVVHTKLSRPKELKYTEKLKELKLGELRLKELKKSRVKTRNFGKAPNNSNNSNILLYAGAGGTNQLSTQLTGVKQNTNTPDPWLARVDSIVIQDGKLKFENKMK